MAKYKAVITLFLISICMAAHAGPAASYKITWLPENLSVNAVNSHGQVVGSQSFGTTTRAYVWSKSSGVTDLGTHNIDTRCSATAIGENGTVYGASYDGVSALSTALSWTPAGIQSVFKPFRNTTSAGYTAVNAIGWAVGFGNYAPGNGPNPVPFVQKGSATAYNLPREPLEVQTIPTGINLSGQVCGFSSSHESALRWSAAGVLEVLPGLTSSASNSASGINDSGMTVGRSFTTHNQAVRWDSSGHISTIAPASVWTSEATCIDNSGMIGGRFLSATGPEHAFLYDDMGGFQDLNVLASNGLDGGTLNTITGLSQNGYVVGMGLHNGVYQAYLAQAVPEPTTLLVFGTGVLAVRKARRHTLRPGHFHR